MRTLPIRLRTAAALLAAIAASACAPGTRQPAQPTPPAAQPIDSALAVATFDTVWNRIATTHFDTAYGGVDWSAVRDELRPQVHAVRTVRELRVLLTDMVGRLGDSHFGIIPREAYTALSADDPREEPSDGEGRPAFDHRLVDGRLLVTSVRDGSRAQEAGIRSGWELVRIGRADVEQALRALREATTDLSPRMERAQAWGLVGRRLTGPEGSIVELTFLDAASDTVRVDAVREPIPGEVVRVIALPPMAAHLEHERRSADGATVGIIRFNVWMAPIARQFALAMDAVRDTDGIIVDLRGNIGGLGAMAMGVSGHFLDTTLTLGTMRTRATTLRFVSSPQRVSPAGHRVRPFTGPLVILVDEASMSTSEIFAAGMQAVGRARIVGDTTTGQALPAYTAPLPNGDVLLHAIADFHDPTGGRIEGRGVIPDVQVSLDRASLLRGRDPMLERAVELIVQLRAQGDHAAPAPGGTPNP